jgi:hypothetical protein
VGNTAIERNTIESIHTEVNKLYPADTTHVYARILPAPVRSLLRQFDGIGCIKTHNMDNMQQSTGPERLAVVIRQEGEVVEKCKIEIKTCRG